MPFTTSTPKPNVTTNNPTTKFRFIDRSSLIRRGLGTSNAHSVTVDNGCRQSEASLTGFFPSIAVEEGSIPARALGLLALGQRMEFIDLRSLNFLRPSAGPVNFNAVDLVAIAEAEMQRPR